MAKLKAELTGQHLFDITAAVSKNVRLSGSPEEAESFAVIQKMLDQAGLKTQLLRHDGYVSLPVRGFIVAGGERLDGITHSFSRQTSSGGVTARVVDAGMDAPDATARGSVVLSDGIAMPGLVLRNERVGAAAQIFVCAEHTHEMCISTIWAARHSANSPTCRSARSSCQRQDRAAAARTDRWRRDGGHGTYRSGHRMAQASAAPRRSLPGKHGGTLDDGETPFVLFSGHLNSWHLGAMDNGTANAKLKGRGCSLSVAGLRRGVRLAFWSGHSHGRYAGSAWYADSHWHDLHERCVRHVNVDSVGAKGASVLEEAPAMAETYPFGREVPAEVAGAALDYRRISRSSDQSFWGHGVPTVFASLSEQPRDDSPTGVAMAQLLGAGARGGGLGWWWHTTEDTLDKIDLDYLQRDGRIYLHACHELLTAPVAPLRIDRQAKAFLAELSAIAVKSATWFDLSHTVELAEAVLAEAEALQKLRDGKSEEDNETLLGVHQALRPFIELSYAGSGEYAHDRTVPIPPVPALAVANGLSSMGETERLHALVSLRRSRNYVEDRLLQAREAIRRSAGRV